MASKKRLDLILVENGLFDSREKARSAILAGKVLVEGAPARKPGDLVDPEWRIEVKGWRLPYVSRGGLKLEAALKAFRIDPSEKIALDVGASTGGFTDCLLQHGAKKVYAVDVGYGQLAWKIRTDPRVIPLERTNIRYIDPALIRDKIDIATIDVSFISLAKVIPTVCHFLEEDGDIAALIKPQFEAGKGEVGKGGVVRAGPAHLKVILKVYKETSAMDLKTRGLVRSPLLGPSGNQEYFIHLRKSGEALSEDELLALAEREIERP